MFFNYSAAQWAAIRREVATIGLKAVSAFDYGELRYAANELLGSGFPPPDERRRALKRVIRLQEELRATVAFGLNDMPSEALLDELDALEAKVKTELFDLEHGWSAKQKLYRVVLDCWGGAGGSFTRSRSKPDDGRKPTGPLVRYVSAALEPIMRDATPGLERILSADRGTQGARSRA